MEAAIELPFAFLSTMDCIVILTVVLILFGVRGFPCGRTGFTFQPRGSMDEDAEDVGRSIGGIAGASAYQPITPKNEVAEIYDPAAINNKFGRRLLRYWRWLTAVYRQMGIAIERVQRRLLKRD